ncbi:MAG: Fis family transcriptional regulator [Pyrobaculum sp.]
MRITRALWARLTGKPLALCDIGDVDGVASAALFKRRYPHGVVVLMGPNDVRKWWVRALRWDFVADLPCPGKARVRADHHITNKPCAEEEYYDPNAPAAAVLAAKALGLEGDPVARELVEAAVQTDTANVSDRRVMLLDLAVRYASEEEKYTVVNMLAEKGLAALDTEPLKMLAERGLARHGLVLKIADALPRTDVLTIYVPTRLGISYRMLAIELQKRGTQFVNVLAKRGWRGFRLYCGANRDSGYNCAELAAKFGGGGHKFAAGAHIKAPLFKPDAPIWNLVNITRPKALYVITKCDTSICVQEWAPSRSHERREILRIEDVRAAEGRSHIA